MNKIYDMLGIETGNEYDEVENENGNQISKEFEFHAWVAVGT